MKRLRGCGPRWVLALAALATTAGCGGGQEEASLRESLAELPYEQAETASVAQPAPAPVDTTPTDAGPAPTRDAATPPSSQLEPPPPTDMRPWIPEQTPLLPSREWTAGIVEQSRPELRPATLVEVRSARHEGFDRVVFEFAEEAVPGYRVGYVDRPVRQCGSGNPVEVAGERWLSVRLTPANAHDEQGRATVENRERMPDLPVLKELQLICDFEGEVEWVLGLASPHRYRVLELREPARLVVDVRH